MSPLRRPRAGRLRGARSRTARQLLLSALIVIGTLLVVRAPGGGIRGDAASDVCVGPVPVDGPCSTTTSATESASGTESATTTDTVTTSAPSGAGTDTGATTSSAGAGTDAATSTETATATTTTATAGAASSGGRPAATPSPTHFPAPPPPLPVPARGGATVAPEEVVQRIVLVPAADGLITPGDSVVVQATPEAQRGTDIYAVPHVPVVFSVVSAAGRGATVVPSIAGSGESGVAVVTVRTGDLPGDTVISASAGSASSQLTLHSVARVTGVAVPVVPPLSGAGHRVSPAGGKVAVAVLLVVAACAAGLLLGVGRLRREGPAEPG
jgi:hypothetical protein